MLEQKNGEKKNQARDWSLPGALAAGGWLAGEARGALRARGKSCVDLK